MWRTLSLIIIGLWLVMTSLLVRVVWFPEGSRFEQVPPGVVLRRFLNQSSAVSSASTLLVYQREKRIGFLNLRCSREKPGSQDFKVSLAGFLDKGAVPFAKDKVMCRFTLKLQEVENFGEFNAYIRLERTPWFMDLTWRKGERAPAIHIQAPEETGLNDAFIQMLLGQATAFGGVPGMAPPDPATGITSTEDAIRVRARQSEMDFAGQKSQGHLLELTIMNRWKARAFITEAGEFVLLDLPEGYRLVEPVIHGLIPDYDDVQEEEAVEDRMRKAGKAK
jgi:hypothetical protein